MKPYTTAIHVDRLERMLSQKRVKPCAKCPGTYYFACEVFIDCNPCEICLDFIGLDCTRSACMKSGPNKCPCYILGPEEAIRISLEKIREYRKEHPK